MTGLVTFLAAFGLSYIGTRLLLRVRLGAGFIDIPNDRSSHEVPKPRFGGIAMVGAFFLVVGVLMMVRPEARSYLPLLIGGGIIFATGVIDDWRSLPVWVRFVMQGVAAVIVVGSGNVIHEITLPMVEPIALGRLAVPLTALLILTCINFYNFIDGIDGLAAGNAAIAAGFMAIIAFALGHLGLALVCLALAGAAAGFLQFNYPPSRLFMGDGGSTFLGFFFAYIAVTGSAATPKIPEFIPLLMLSALFVDAGFTLAKRALRGEKILQAHRTHYFQRLVSLGFNHKQVTLLEYGLTILLGLSALVYFSAGRFFPAVIAALWVAVFGALMLRIRGLERGDRMFWERRTFLVIASDLVLIAVAYFGAFFLRTGFQFPEPFGMAVVKAFPVVLIVRSACFHYYGLYRGMWKYTSTPDVLRIVKAVTVGSVIIVMVLVLAYRFVAIPRSLVVIESFLLVLVLTGSRFANRLFHELGREALEGTVKRVAIIGAGDYGERLGREIRNTEGPNTAVVCYIDDDKEKSGLILQGVPILGPISDLPQICSSYQVDAIQLGIRELPAESVRSIVDHAHDAKVPIERGDVAYPPAPESDYIIFDRLSQDLGRTLPVRVNEATESFYRNKRVLITNGGGVLGPMLASELLVLGADVTIQVESAYETRRFAVLRDRAGTVITNFDREVEARRALEAADPQVVLHILPLVAPHSLNQREYLWRRTLRSARAIKQTLGGYRVESLVACVMWEETPIDGYAAALGAAAETTILNAPELVAFGPKVVRLPRVLTQADVERAVAMDGSAATDETRFVLHELEAVTLILNAAASYKGRTILVPRLERSLTVGDVRRAARCKEAEGSVAPAAGEVFEAGPIFPTETLRPSVLSGTKQVVSPIHPASDVLVSYVAQCMHEFDETQIDQSLRLLRSVLFERVPELPVDESTA